MRHGVCLLTAVSSFDYYWVKFREIDLAVPRNGKATEKWRRKATGLKPQGYDGWAAYGSHHLRLWLGMPGGVFFWGKCCPLSLSCRAICCCALSSL